MEPRLIVVGAATAGATGLNDTRLERRAGRLFEEWTI